MILQLISYVNVCVGSYCTDSEIFSFWATLVSAIAVAITVAILAWQIFLQRKEMKVNEYSELRQHHHDLITNLFENEKTLVIYDHVPPPEKCENLKIGDTIELTKEEKIIFDVYVAEFDLYERVRQTREDGIITQYEWLCWLLYLESMSHNWLFRYVYNQTNSIFFPELMDDVLSYIIAIQDSHKDSRKNLIEEIKKAYSEEYGETLVLNYAEIK